MCIRDSNKALAREKLFPAKCPSRPETAAVPAGHRKGANRDCCINWFVLTRRFVDTLDHCLRGKLVLEDVGPIRVRMLKPAADWTCRGFVPPQMLV